MISSMDLLKLHVRIKDAERKRNYTAAIALCKNLLSIYCTQIPRNKDWWQNEVDQGLDWLSKLMKLQQELIKVDSGFD